MTKSQLPWSQLSGALRLWQALRLRVLTALTLLPIVLSAIYFGGWLFYIFVMIASFLLVHEWVYMLKSSNPKNIRAVLMLIILPVVFSAIALSPDQTLVIWIGLMGVCALISFGLHIEKFVLLGGYAYLSLPLVALIFLRQLEAGAQLVFYLFVVVWLTDIFAMLFGKTIGGPKLSPIISPNKTWAGLLGGMMGAAFGGVIIALVFGWQFGEPFSLKEAGIIACLSALLAVIAQFGDLLESWIKRKYDVKDSGSILPGHGGILDRVDGVISVLVVAFLVLFINDKIGMTEFTAPTAIERLLVW